MSAATPAPAATDNMCHVLLVRHARTAWNVAGLTQSHRDVPLDATGKAMAAALTTSPWFDHPVAAIYSSDLRRALETVEPVAAKLGVTIRRDPRLREGRQRPSPSDVYPELPFPVDREKPGDLARRAVACMEEIATKHVGERVMVMSHGGTIRNFLTAVLGRNVPQPNVTNTAVCHLTWQAGRWTPHCLYDCAHLERGDLSAGALDAG